MNSSFSAGHLVTVTPTAIIPPERQLKAGDPLEMDTPAFLTWLRLMRLTAVIVEGEMKKWMV